MAPPVAVAWFRRDLRLADNPALLAAVDQGAVVPVFVHDPALAVGAGANRTAYLHATLDALDARLDGNLVERCGPPARVLADLVAETGAGAVFATADHGPYGRRRDAAVRDAGVELRLVDSPCAVPPGSVQTKGGTPFRVFTPYARAWREHGWPPPRPEPARPRWVGGVGSDPRPDTPAPEATDGLPPAGEDAAWDAVGRFLSEGVDGYDRDRDRPDLDATSRLSPHLKFGTVHPRQLLAELGDTDGAATFASELAWRDFYATVLFDRPDSVSADYTDTLHGLEWDTGPVADERFEAWCRGRTGYPIVDAGMRQLLAEGWMHNRVRMIVASFLVKDLHIDWRRGAAWFMRHLFDGDVASNTHGWQWTAGTGTDAAPFFRVFNPTRQGERFDPDGAYVRRYVPELAEPGGDLFSGPAADYPEPIVDHAAERAEALRRYRER